MTIAIIAANSATAAQAADNLGLDPDEWICPGEMRDVRGYLIERIIWVEGWRRSTVLTPSVLDAIRSRHITTDEDELAHPYGMLHAEAGARLARLVLSAERRPARPTVASIQPGTMGRPVKRAHRWRVAGSFQ